MLRNLSIAAVAALAVAPVGVFAQTTAAQAVAPASDTAFLFNTLFMLLAGLLVMWMAVGFTMLEAGFVRSKNVAMQITKNISAYAVAGAGFLIIGAALQNPVDGWAIDGFLSGTAPGWTGIEDAGSGAPGQGGVASGGASFFLQLMFCATTISIVSGAVAERVRLIPFMLFALAITSVIYPLQASWSWGGGFLADLGFVDHAGSVVVHTVGGWAALAGVVILGPRVGKFRADGRVNPLPGSSLPLSALGALILWFGWFGFNGGSAVMADAMQGAVDIGRVVVNTNAAGVGGVLAGIILTRALYSKVDLTLVLNCGLAGLVSITADPVHASPGLALIIGAIGGAIVVLGVPLLDRFRLDDVVGAVPVHLGAGIWGGVAAGFVNPEGSVIAQLVGIGLIGCFVFGVSIVMWFALKLVIGLRFNPEVEADGLDLNELGLEAYPDFVGYEDA
ncbi:MAG: ammonium transporter [Pseudomonadota bacterium]